MENIYEVTIDSCYGVKLARSWALRRCALNVPSLRYDFNKSFDPNDSTEEFSKKLGDFVRSKGLRILDEKPIVRIVDDRYRVDVRFKVTW